MILDRRATPRRSPLWLGLGILLASPAQAVDYYVNDGSTEGDVYTRAQGLDANDGLSPDAPKASLRAVLAAYVLGPGDRVLIDVGRYDLGEGRVRLGPEHQGLPGEPIEIRGVPGGQGAVFYSDLADPADVFLLAGEPDRPLTSVSLIDLRFETATWGVAFTNARDLVFEGCLFRGQRPRPRLRGASRRIRAAGIKGDLWEGGSRGITIERCSFRDIAGPAVELWNVPRARFIDSLFAAGAPGTRASGAPPPAQVQLRGTSRDAALRGCVFLVSARDSAALSVDLDATPGFSSREALYRVSGAGAVLGVWGGIACTDLPDWRTKRHTPWPALTDADSHVLSPSPRGSAHGPIDSTEGVTPNLASAASRWVSLLTSQPRDAPLPKLSGRWLCQPGADVFDFSPNKKGVMGARLGEGSYALSLDENGHGWVGRARWIRTAEKGGTVAVSWRLRPDADGTYAGLLAEGDFAWWVTLRRQPDAEVSLEDQAPAKDQASAQEGPPAEAPPAEALPAEAPAEDEAPAEGDTPAEDEDAPADEDETPAEDAPAEAPAGDGALGEADGQAAEQRPSRRGKRISARGGPAARRGTA